MRATQTHKDGRVCLGSVEAVRIEDPCEHLLAVSGGDPALFADGLLQLGENIVVLVGQLFPAAVGQRDRDNLRRPHHRLVGGNQTVCKHCRGIEVVPFVIRGYPFHLVCVKVEAPDLLHTLDEGCEVDVPLVSAPDGNRTVVLEIGGNLEFLAVLEVHHEDADLVGLVAGSFHAAPSDAVAVGAENGLGVVARHALGEVLAGSGSHVIKIYVSIG